MKRPKMEASLHIIERLYCLLPTAYCLSSIARYVIWSPVSGLFSNSSLILPFSLFLSGITFKKRLDIRAVVGIMYCRSSEGGLFIWK